MAKPPTNIAASVRQRLLNLARQEQRLFNVVLVSYGLERVIYRLSISTHANKFILKGGMLVTLWTVDHGRFTRDVDFLGFGAFDSDRLITAFKEILAFEANDGLVFDVDGLAAAPIREDQKYGGIRLKTIAFLGKTEIPITIDVGFGDAITDPSYMIEYASLIDLPTAKLRAYSPATVIAEKFQAVVALGLINGRMKDFYDLWAIPQSTKIDSADLDAAIKATFERRETSVPRDRPDGLTVTFAEQKSTQWRAYAHSINLENIELGVVVEAIWTWLEPSCRRLTK